MKKLCKSLLFAAAIVAVLPCAACAQNTAKGARGPDLGNNGAAIEITSNDLRQASGVMNVDGNAYTSVTSNSLIAGGSMQNGTFSCTVRSTNQTDSGIVFGLSRENREYFWEAGVSYYFYFLGQGGYAYLGKVNNGWYILQTKKIDAINAEHAYELKVVKNGNRMVCFVDGELMFGYKDLENSLTGKEYGLRTGAPGVTFADFQVTSEIDYI